MFSLDESWNDFFADRQARKDADKIVKFFQKEAEEQIKMTREDALGKITKAVSDEKGKMSGLWIGERYKILNILEALGLIKFEEERKITKTVQMNEDNYFGDFGIIRVETWPEGLVIWVGGEIVYKSWKV